MDFSSILQMAGGFNQTGQDPGAPYSYPGYPSSNGSLPNGPLPHPYSIMNAASTSLQSDNANGRHDDSNTGSTSAAPKKTRKRQQTSCSECHRRKQKCNKEVPCDRCIKRGAADTCRIVIAGEQDDSSGEGESRNSPPIDMKRRKRKEQSAEEGLALRVQQLENLIRQQGLNISPPVTATSEQYKAPAIPTSRSPNETPSSVQSLGPQSATNTPQTAVEEAAVAALGQLSKAIPQEGGTEARIYNGPGSVTDFLGASVFSSVQADRTRRARPADMRLYHGINDIYGLAHAPGRLARLADVLREHKAKLPPAPLCHHLWNYFFELAVFSDRHRVFPRGALQIAYDGLWTEADGKDMSPGAVKARAQGFPQLASPTSLAFMALVFVMLASSLSFTPDAAPETHQLASAMYEASRECVMASERREQPTYAVIGALLSQIAWLKVVGCPSFGFTYYAQAIRYAQSMGLHREPAPNWGLGGFEVEIRRRLWHSLVLGDRFHSISYGRPYIINEKHCDVKMPSNIYESDLTPEGPVNIRPWEECTTTTASLVSIKFSRVVVEIIDRAFSCVTPSYSTILELDNLLTTTEQEVVPFAFKNRSITDLVEKPYLREEYNAFQIQVLWLRALLHRPYLLKPLPKSGEPDHFAGSRAAAIMLSQRSITLAKEKLQDVPLHLQAYFGYAFNCFEPAVNLSMAILQDPGSANAPALDKYVQDAMRLLERMQSVNKVAREGLETLTFMRERYSQAMEEAKSISPATSTSRSGLSKPSPFSMTNSSSGPSPDSIQTPPNPLPAMPQLVPAPPDEAPTPNTLFNQFISQYAASPAAPSSSTNNNMISTATSMDTNLEKLFSFDPAVFETDPNAAWLTQPIDGGLEAWPHGMSRLEGETDFGDWKKMLGL